LAGFLTPPTFRQSERDETTAPMWSKLVVVAIVNCERHDRCEIYIYSSLYSMQSSLPPLFHYTTILLVGSSLVVVVRVSMKSALCLRCFPFYLSSLYKRGLGNATGHSSIDKSLTSFLTAAGRQCVEGVVALDIISWGGK
jgi:hypothetical protein